MAQKKTVPTTTKHPTKKKFIATKTTAIGLGGGKKMEVEKGDILRTSDEYEGQAGRSVLVAPQGNHSKFVLSPDTLKGVFKPIRPGSEQLNTQMRDNRGTHSEVQTGGRRGPAEISGDESAPQPEAEGPFKFKKSKQKSEEQPMKLAAGDQYDLEGVTQLVEELKNYSFDQLCEFVQHLDSDAFDVLLETLEKFHSTEDLKRKLTTAHRVLQKAPEGSARSRRAEKFLQKLGDLQHPKRNQEDSEQNAAARAAHNQFHAERRGVSPQENEEQNATMKSQEFEGHGKVGKGGLLGDTTTAPKTGGKSVGASDAGQAAATNNLRTAGSGTSTTGGRKRPRKGGGVAALDQATKHVKIPKEAVPVLRTIGASYEPTEPQIMENYVETATQGDVLNFAETIRNSLDAHAHAAVESIKNSMIGYAETEEQMDESVDQLLEYVDSLDEQQLNEYFDALSDEELDLVEQLLDEAKYGTKKGRHRLAMKISAGKDVGKKGKNFEKIAKKATKRYGSAKSGRAVAAAAMWKSLGGKRK